MRGNLGGADPLHRIVNNLALSLQEEKVIIPRDVPLEDMLWKFSGSEDPIAITNCSEKQLLAVVKGLIGKITDLEDEVLREQSAKKAALKLLE